MWQNLSTTYGRYETEYLMLRQAVLIIHGYYQLFGLIVQQLSLSQSEWKPRRGHRNAEMHTIVQLYKQFWVSLNLYGIVSNHKFYKQELENCQLNICNEERAEEQSH